MSNKKKNHFHKCCMCGKKATWYKEIHQKGDALYYCDDCVPRGDISNVDNIEEWGEPMIGTLVMWWDANSVKADLLKDGHLERTPTDLYYEYLDMNGKRYPSTKFEHDINGFIIEDKKTKYTSTDNIYDVYNKTKIILSPLELKSVSTSIAEVLLNHETTNKKIAYNDFMSQLGSKIKHKTLTIAYQNNIGKFYNKFKYELAKITT